MRKFFLLGLILVGVANAKPALLPMPQEVEFGKSTYSIKTARLKFPRLKGDEEKKLKFAISDLKRTLAANKVKVSAKGRYEVCLKLGEVKVPRHENEAYSMKVSQTGTVITAPKVAGLFYGIQTLRQLIEQKRGSAVITQCTIVDYPAFKIRGYMQDVGRNFQTLKLLKSQIDVMAAYKHNIFHFHVTENPGWRLESKKYPQLQDPKNFTRKPGKFYTQKEFVELVEYCYVRNITLIPEFDTPGHSAAFRKAFGIKMADPKAKQYMVELINELCSLVPKEKMPYIHLGTDEVRHADERVGKDYLPALNKAVRDNNREVIGWWHGMHVPGDAKQIQQTWARHHPRGGNRHIDSRSNYVNHLSAFDAPLRLLFQQPCRKPYGDDINLGGILCYWPDLKVDDENVGMTNAPVFLTIVAYSESVWTGIKVDKPEFWAKMPPKGTPEFEQFVDYEARIIAQRRFLKGKPFLYLKQTDIPWKIIGPFKSSQLTNADSPEKGFKESYKIGDKEYKWWEQEVYGATTHIKHFFGFHSITSRKKLERGDDIVYAQNYIYSPKNQEVDFWISFNTTSSSDTRSGVADKGFWNKNRNCNIWINDKVVPPPNWAQPGKSGKEIAFIDEIYTSRKPTVVELKKGWNKVLVKTAPTWKWSFTCVPVKIVGKGVTEVEGLKFSTTPGK